MLFAERPGQCSADNQEEKRPPPALMESGVDYDVAAKSDADSPQCNLQGGDRSNPAHQTKLTLMLMAPGNCEAICSTTCEGV